MASPITESLQNLTNYLVGENVRKEEKFEKEKAKVSAQRVAQAFKSVRPDTDESSVRKLVYDVIADTATLDSLDENLPLINSLYTDSLRNIQNYKVEQRDKALFQYAQTEGYAGPVGLSGEQALQVLEYQKSLEKGYDIYDTQGKSYHAIYDRFGKEIQRIAIDPRGDINKLGFKIAEIEAQEKARQRFKDRADYIQYAGITAEGLPITLNKQTGLFYVPSFDEAGNVAMRPLGPDEKVIRGTQNAITQAAKMVNLYQDMASESRKTAEDTGRQLLALLGETIPPDIAGKPMGNAYSYVNTLLKGEDLQAKQNSFAEMINEKFSGAENASMRAQAWQLFNQYLGARAETESTQGLVSQSKDALLYDQALQSNDITTKDYNELYGAVQNTVGLENAVGDLLRQKISLNTGVSKTATPEELLKAFNQLSHANKARIFKEMKTEEENQAKKKKGK